MTKVENVLPCSQKSARYLLIYSQKEGLSEVRCATYGNDEISSLETGH